MRDHPWEQRVARMLAGEAKPQETAAVFEHVAGCASCRALYNRYRQLEDAVGAEQRALPALALERIGAVVEARAQAPRSRRTLAMILVPLAAAPLAVLAVVMMPTEPEPELVPRSGEVKPDAAVGVRVLEITQAGARPATTLTRGSVVTFTYTNNDPALRYLALVGVTSNGELTWYYPGADGTESKSIASAVVDEPLGDGFEVSSSGIERLVALFSSKPLSRADIEDAITKGRAVGWDNLNLDGVMVHRVELDAP